MADKTHPTWNAEHKARLKTPKSSWVRVDHKTSSKDAHLARKSRGHA